MRKNITICFFGTYDKTYTSNKLILRGLRENKITVHEVNAHTDVVKLTKAEELSPWALFKRILRKYHLFGVVLRNLEAIKTSDAIYVGYPGHFDVIPAWIVAKIFRKKIVFNPLLIFYIGFSEEQGILSQNSFFGKLIKWGEIQIYKMCDLVFADTPYQRDFLIKDFCLDPEKVISLPLGGDDQFYSYTPYTNTKSHSINVTYYGLYSPIHGVEHIIEAANMLRGDPDIHFSMIGNGNTFDKNFSRAKKLGLKNITFHYDVPPEQHPIIMHKADLFVGFLQDHPTIYKVIPNKVYQGLALGKIIVAADAPVMRSVFTHKKNVYLCKPSDPKDFVKAILELKNDPQLRTSIARNGHALFVEQFTPKAVAKQMIDHIANIV